MPAPKSVSELVGAILACHDKTRTCLVDAVLIEGRDARIDAALKCLTTHTDCTTSAVSLKVEDQGVSELIDHLRSHVEVKTRK